MSLITWEAKLAREYSLLTEEPLLKTWKDSKSMEGQLVMAKELSQELMPWPRAGKDPAGSGGSLHGKNSFPSAFYPSKI